MKYPHCMVPDVMSSPTTIVSGKVFKMPHLRFWFRSWLKFVQLGDFEDQRSLANINGLPGCTMVATEIPGEWSVPIWDFHPAWSQLCRVKVAMPIERFDDIWVPTPQKQDWAGNPTLWREQQKRINHKSKHAKTCGLTALNIFFGVQVSSVARDLQTRLNFKGGTRVPMHQRCSGCGRGSNRAPVPHHGSEISYAKSQGRSKRCGKYMQNMGF